MRYEILILANPQITGDEASNLEVQAREIIREKGGDCLSFERWGKFRLSYPVKHHEYGVYFLIRFEATQTGKVQELLASLRALIALKYNEIVMRFLVNSLEANASLAYQRPESLEEVPGKGVDSLLREHKVDFGGDDMRMSREEEL